MNLIANTGIQFHTEQLVVSSNSSFKMFFHERFDMEEKQLKLEVAHYFQEDDQWVRKYDLHHLGFLTIDGKVGCWEDGKFKPYGWDAVRDDFSDYGKVPIKPNEGENGDTDCFSIGINRLKWEKFENRWLPLPFFEIDGKGRSQFGPTNWCRMKLVPEKNTPTEKKYQILLAFDTRAEFEGEDFEENELKEMPVFASNYEEFKDFSICTNEFFLVDFCSSGRNTAWVDDYLCRLYHNVNQIDEIKLQRPKLNYLAQYITLVRFIQQSGVLPVVKLFPDRNIGHGQVDLVLDIGNSRTCAVLFDQSDFTKVDYLELQNFSQPIKDGKLNKQCDPFDMRLAFRAADFGENMVLNSSQFVYPSFVRLGNEASDLIYKTTNERGGTERMTTFSSPKRFLWDNKPQESEWEFVTLNGESKKPFWIRGISEQLNPDGSLNPTGSGGVVSFYSRRALMTFGFLEILSQAMMQMNSYPFRKKWGNERTPRKLGRIIITCPTAMSSVEQHALRRTAEDAAIILKRFYSGTYYQEINEVRARMDVNIIPAPNKFRKSAERREWFYDEATCAQFVYLYAEIKERYLCNVNEYFEYYGNVRSDINGYEGKSVTIGSIDIGAGTTDLMIAAYKKAEGGQAIITPVPLYWESFYIAGDDLLKEMVREFVIQGPFSAIQKQMQQAGQSTNDSMQLVLDFFGRNNARQSILARQIRSEFNLQVAMPVVHFYLDLLKEGVIHKKAFTYQQIFADKEPTERVKQHFERHFGFSIQTLVWHYDANVVSNIIERTFDPLASKISTILSYYGCDIVLLSGRPTSLRPLTDLFLKYYPVAPNRLVTLNDYRVGTWYPFQDGSGYFRDSKSIVAVGSMIGNYCSERGGMGGFMLNMDELAKRMEPTTEYFTLSEREKRAFISPEVNNAEIVADQLPLRIWCRQLNTESYPTRPFYTLRLDQAKIEAQLKSRFQLNDIRELKARTEEELSKIRNRSPFYFNISRPNYMENKEELILESVSDRNREDLPLNYFSLQVQSMAELETYWMDSGEFENLRVNH